MLQRPCTDAFPLFLLQRWTYLPPPLLQARTRGCWAHGQSRVCGGGVIPVRPIQTPEEDGCVPSILDPFSFCLFRYFLWSVIFTCNFSFNLNRCVMLCAPSIQMLISSVSNSICVHAQSNLYYATISDPESPNVIGFEEYLVHL